MATDLLSELIYGSVAERFRRQDREHRAWRERQGVDKKAYEQTRRSSRLGAEQTWTEWASSMNPLASAPAAPAPAPVYPPGVYLDPASPQVGLIAEAFRTAIQMAQARSDAAKAQQLFSAQVTWWNRSRLLGLTDPGAIVAAALFAADMLKVRADLEPHLARLAPAATSKGAEIVEKGYLDYAADFARGTADTVLQLQERVLTTADKALKLPKEIGDEGGDDLIRIAKIVSVGAVGAVGIAVLGSILRDTLAARRPQQETS